MIRKPISASTNSTLAMPAAPAETLVNPRKPVTTEMRKKMRAHFNMPAAFLSYAAASGRRAPRRGRPPARRAPDDTDVPVALHVGAGDVVDVLHALLAQLLDQ